MMIDFCKLLHLKLHEISQAWKSIEGKGEKKNALRVFKSTS